ncbi:TPA: exo-alpha-sialidase [Acinetobacter baumannii]|nr:exo-alpha-sialidase [Acinetobacter baumannii]
MAQQTIVIEVPGTPISELEPTSSVSSEDVLPVVQGDQTKKAPLEQVADLVKSGLGTAALKNESDFATPSVVAEASQASQLRDDAQNERIDAVEHGLVSIGNGADASFSTYAEMLAYVPTKANVSVRNNDPDPELRGVYIWTGTEYVAGYDPLVSSIEYTDQQVGKTTGQTIKIIDSKSMDIDDQNVYRITASGGEEVFKIDENAKAHVVDLNVGGKDLSELFDEAKDEVLKIDENKILYAFPDQSAVNNVFTISEDGRLLGIKPYDMGIESLFAKAASNSEMTKIGYYHDYLKAKSKEPYNFSTQIYIKNDPADGFTNEKTARMPSIIKISDNKIFVCWVVFDKIANSDQSHGVMLGRFVNFDLKNKTATVDTNTVVVAGERGVTTEALRHAVFTRILNKETGKFRYLCLYNSGSFATNNIKVHIIYSDDDCKTWSQQREVMDQNTHAATALVPDSLHRIQKGEFAGRLVCGGFGVNADKTGYNVGIIFSDDNGQTWRNGSTIDNTAFNTADVTYGFLNETSVCLDNSGDLLLAIRNESASSLAQRTVLFARSKDGGNTLYVDKDEPRIETSICQVGLLQAAKNLQEGIPKILLSFPSEPFASSDAYTRRSLRIGFSWNNGKSYPLMYSPRKSDAVSGYTHMIALTDQDFVLVEEPSETIIATFFNMSHVIKNGVFIDG